MSKNRRKNLLAHSNSQSSVKSASVSLNPQAGNGKLMKKAASAETPKRKRRTNKQSLLPFKVDISKRIKRSKANMETMHK